MCASEQVYVLVCTHRGQKKVSGAYSFKIKPLLNLRLMSSCQAGSQQDPKVLFVSIRFRAGVTSVHSFVMCGLRYKSQFRHS